MSKVINPDESLGAEPQSAGIELAVAATAFFKDGTSTPCLIHRIAKNEADGQFGLQVELINYKGAAVPDEYFVYIQEKGYLIRYKTDWKQRL